MVKTGRNAPCPCGSGKKYKHCCSAQKVEYQKLLMEQYDAKQQAVDWLMEHYGDTVDYAIANYFFQDPKGDMRQRIVELPQNTQLAILICLHEWLIGDADLFVNNDWVRANELLLGPDGPLFTPDGRRHIEALAASTLSLYEVLEVHKGKGLLLRDMLRADEPPVFAHEVKATETLVPWDTLGARILRQKDKYAIGGGVCLFRRYLALQLADFLVKEIKRETKKKHPLANIGVMSTYTIIIAWLDAITKPPSMPMLMDAQTKEPILFTTDTYRVSDWRALEDILAAQNDVEEDENQWVWAEYISEDEFRSRAHLRRLSSGILEVECRTKGRADAAGTWLKQLADPLISHIDRTTVDPREQLQNTQLPQSEPRKKTENGIPLKIQKKVIGKFLAEHYENWPNMPLPALNGKTPLQAAKLKTYRPKLIELLKNLEHGEAKRANTSGLPAFDFGVLRKRLGLDDESEYKQLR